MTPTYQAAGFMRACQAAHAQVAWQCLTASPPTSCPPTPHSPHVSPPNVAPASPGPLLPRYMSELPAHWGEVKARVPLGELQALFRALDWCARAGAAGLRGAGRATGGTGSAAPAREGWAGGWAGGNSRSHLDPRPASRRGAGLQLRFPAAPTPRTRRTLPRAAPAGWASARTRRSPLTPPLRTSRRRWRRPTGS